MYFLHIKKKKDPKALQCRYTTLDHDYVEKMVLLALFCGTSTFITFR